jgi:hypothetical protein
MPVNPIVAAVGVGLQAAARSVRSDAWSAAWWAAWWAEFSAGELQRHTEKLIINLPADSEARASNQGFAVYRKNISSFTNLDVGLS